MGEDFYEVARAIDSVIAPDLASAAEPELTADEQLPDTVFLLIGIDGTKMDVIKAFTTETLAKLYQNCGMVGGYLKKYCGGLVIKKILVHKCKTYDYSIDATVDNFKSVPLPIDIEGEIIVPKRQIEHDH